MRYALTHKRKNILRFFLEHLYFNNVYSTGTFSELILKIA